MFSYSYNVVLSLTIDMYSIINTRNFMAMYVMNDPLNNMLFRILSYSLLLGVINNFINKHVS